MQVTPTRAFLRDLKNISRQDADAVADALEMFMQDPKAKPLNFEPVKSRRGYFTIRASYKTRVLLLQQADDAFDVVAVGNHDYIYVSYFKK
ncbi:hypothetical protein [Xanthobacter flavus]|uniref:hypothetical protein n=1 Tax=Xanthobacter flavus TaxID=281 RepID=UPI0037296C40